MPWQNNGGGGWQGGGGRNPWGGKPPGGGQPPPNLDDLIKKGQEQLKGVLPGGIGGRSGVFLIVALVAALWMLSGIYSIKPGEVGVVTAFGRFYSLATPGLNYHFPYPFQAVEVVSVEEVHETRIGGVPVRTGRTRTTDRRTNTLMLTGDENIVDIKFTVFWQIADGPDYLFNIQTPQEDSVRVAAESALREIIGQTNIEDALTRGRDRIQQDTLTLTQSILDGYGAGINIREVQLLEVDPPQQVVAAFRDVQAAEADKVRVQNEAQTYANKIVPEAQGQALRLIQNAEAYREQVIAQAEGEASRFISVYDQYVQAKDVTRRRIYLETMESILSGMDKIILDNSAGSGVVPYLPLPEVQQRRQANAPAGTSDE